MSEPRRSEVAGAGVPVLCRDAGEESAVRRVAVREPSTPRADARDPRRATRVARLARAVQAGSYRPDARAIAAAMLAAMDAALGAGPHTPPPA